MVHTKLTEHAGVEYPIICGAMYPCSNPELVAAAAEGGATRAGGAAIVAYTGKWSDVGNFLAS